MIKSGQSGRINLDSSVINKNLEKNLSPYFSHPTSVGSDFENDMLRGNWESSDLSKMFFNTNNVSEIQSQLKRQVYNRSGSKKYQIDNQDVDELQMIMRAMFLQYARNDATNIQGQVNTLNDLVVNWSVPRIISSVDSYAFYLKDIQTMPLPMQQPVCLSGAGTRSLPFQQLL